MYSLEKYALEKQQDKEVLKKFALLKFVEGELNQNRLETLIDRAYELGHYAGHCRGELCVRIGYDLNPVEEK